MCTQKSCPKVSVRCAINFRIGCNSATEMPTLSVAPEQGHWDQAVGTEDPLVKWGEAHDLPHPSKGAFQVVTIFRC